MWEPDTHQAILQAFAEPEVIATGSKKEGGEEKGREGDDHSGTKDVDFSSALGNIKAFKNVECAC